MSSKFGINSVFNPPTVFNYSDLSSITPPPAAAKSKKFSIISSSSSSSPNYDFVVVSPSSLRSLTSLHKSLSSKIIVPNHTIILIDSTNYVGLDNLIKKHYPKNPICHIFSKASIKRYPSNSASINATTSSSSSLSTPLSSTIVHTGDETQAYISPVASGFSSSLSQRLKSFVLALQTSGVDAVIPQNFNQLKWEQTIEFITFQPLSVILETPSQDKLVDNVLAKPLYSGLALELMAISKAHSNCTFPSNFSQSLVKQAAAAGVAAQKSKDIISSVKYSNASLLFYNFYHKIPLHVDLLLLQPILLADDLGIKSPYLESIFSFLSQLDSYNTKSSSLFFSRTASKSTSPYDQKPLPLPVGSLTNSSNSLLKDQQLTVPQLPSVNTSSTDSFTEFSNYVNYSNGSNGKSGSPKPIGLNGNTSASESVPIQSLPGAFDSSLDPGATSLALIAAEKTKLADRVQELEDRELQLRKREQALATREQKMANISSNLRQQQAAQSQIQSQLQSQLQNQAAVQPQPQPQSHPHLVRNNSIAGLPTAAVPLKGGRLSSGLVNSPLPQHSYSFSGASQMYGNGPSNGPGSYPPNGTYINSLGPQLSSIPSAEETIDMMNLTSRRSRRSISTKARKSHSTASLADLTKGTDSLHYNVRSPVSSPILTSREVMSPTSPLSMHPRRMQSPGPPVVTRRQIDPLQEVLSMNSFLAVTPYNNGALPRSRSNSMLTVGASGGSVNGNGLQNHQHKEVQANYYNGAVGPRDWYPSEGTNGSPILNGSANSSGSSSNGAPGSNAPSPAAHQLNGHSSSNLNGYAFASGYKNRAYPGQNSQPQNLPSSDSTTPSSSSSSPNMAALEPLSTTTLGSVGSWKR